MKINREIILQKILNEGNPLIPIQSIISIPIIERIYKKMEQNIKFASINISSDRHIIDGHHRYISSLLSNFDLEEVHNYPKPNKVNEYKWEDVEFTEEDWDSRAKIKMLNKKDALFNDMSMEDIENLIADKTL